jgi:hypothetical protein
MELVASPDVAKKIGRIAQLAERHLYTVDVAGSIPVPPTKGNAGLRGQDRIEYKNKNFRRDKPLDIALSPTSSAIRRVLRGRRSAG